MFIPIFDRIRQFYAKNDRKKLMSYYQITIILKTRGFLGQFKRLSLLNDEIRHISAKKKTERTRKIDVELQKYYKLTKKTPYF